MALVVHHSNRMETLLETLDAELSSTPQDPFTPVALVVQNQGMAVWVKQQLAARHGICANLDFPLPASFFWRVLCAWMPDAQTESAYDKGVMAWHIAGLLPNLASQPGFAKFAEYARKDDGGLSGYQLAQRIAETFDQYLVYRADLLKSWERGVESHWQARLWRALVKATGGTHRASLFDALLQSMADSLPKHGLLPSKIMMLGLNSLPPLYLRVLDALSAHVEVSIFYLNPCREYWADIQSERGIAIRRAKAFRAGKSDMTPLLDLGNPLLASLGRAGQVFLDQLLELQGVDEDRFEEPGSDTILACIQHDILTLHDARESPRRMADDGSIRVQSAHSRLREVQILHDSLLRQFDRLPGLKADEILVMAPDMDQYAPLVQAVFISAPFGQRIPFNINSAASVDGRAVLGAMNSLLALPSSRFEVSEVLALLETSAVARKFALDAEALGLLRKWVGDSGIRWGLDSGMRAQMGLPPEDANSWNFGLDRLFLGYAMPDDADKPWQGVLPYTDIEGNDAELLGKLAEFVAALSRVRDRLSGTAPIERWHQTICQLIAEFFDPDEDEEARLQELRDALDEVVAQATLAGYSQAVPLTVMRSAVLAGMQKDGSMGGLMRGGVTFCNMVPMRGIPFRVICLLGMGDMDFPRRQIALSFDLIASAPRREDRSRRQDDLYLFLEALLSARDHLHLSFVGKDQHSNSDRVPSVALAALMEYLDQGFVSADGKGMLAELFVAHRLQPFSERYFDGSDRSLFSYSDYWLNAAMKARQPDNRPFIQQLLPAQDDGLRTVSLDDLVRFWSNPSAEFLIRRLGLRKYWQDQQMEDVEPMAFDRLEQYQIDQQILQLLMDGAAQVDIEARLRLQGSLPHGSLGAIWLDERLGELQPFAEKVQSQGARSKDALLLNLEINGFQLTGSLVPMEDGSLLRYRFAKLKAKDLLCAWIEHLAYQVALAHDIPARSKIIAADKNIEYPMIEDAQALLADLLELRRQGLQYPLPFFPESSFSQAKGSGVDAAWHDHFNERGDALDWAARILYRGVLPQEGRFAQLAMQIFGRLIEFTKTAGRKGVKK